MFNKFSYFLYVHTLFRLILLGYSAANIDHKKHLLSEFKTLIVQCLFAMFGGVGIYVPPCNGRNFVMEMVKFIIRST